MCIKCVEVEGPMDLKNLKNIILASFIGILLLSPSLLAGDCYFKLLEPAHDSSHFRFYADEINLIRGLTRSNAQKSIIHLLKSLNCSASELNFKTTSCSAFSNRSEFTVCHIESNIGYFYIMMDYVDSVNIIFNRWD